jgi:predicted pyridoxine 5'-phosphate oxidase superfamily flavin-nucleotide-binding protein
MPSGVSKKSTRSVLAWADLRGNRQYLSVGNLAASPRVSLFLMDYAHQQRLKIIGTAETFGIITVTVHGYDWNCPKHITPRYTEAELAEALSPVREELTRLRAENAALRRQLADGSRLAA